MPAIRKSLESSHFKTPEHAGLWLDRFFKDAEDKAKKSEHLKRVVQKPLPKYYKEFVGRWKEALPTDTSQGVFKTTGRLITGLGAESLWENNITLHHTWGVPVIHGSSLKGLAASYAHRRLTDPAWRRPVIDKQGNIVKGKEGGASHTLMFGTTEEQGCVIFHDALFAAENPDNGLRQDVITVHHQSYHTDGKTAPAEWDSPVPVPFLSVTGKFLVAVSGPEKWRTKALEILKLALEEEGIGAKTSSGYGRLKG